MITGKYRKIIVIGFGSMVDEVLELLLQAKEKFGYEIEVVSRKTAFGCYGRREGVPWTEMDDHENLTRYFLEQMESTLVISAGNYYLFPQEVISKENIRIINFHNALLPKYPGRNAETWAIYYGEKETGITWHFVTPEIDAGEIIIQKKCPIAEDEKAYQLAKKLIELAVRALEECFESVVSQTIISRKQAESDNRRIYLSKEIPAEGKFLLTEKGEDIFRLLRALDYGKSGVFPQATTEYNGEIVRIIRYQKVALEKKEAKDSIFIPINDKEALKLKFTNIKSK